MTRAEWLAALRPGDAVTLHGAKRKRLPAQVSARFYGLLAVETGGTRYLVSRDTGTGTLLGKPRLHIQPERTK